MEPDLLPFGIPIMINWNKLDTLLLDLDGTLLDLHYDNHFWLEHVPQRYAEARRLPLEAARAEILARYRRVEGTLDWYCVDYWSRELELDIPQLKEEVTHLIAVHPHVIDFLVAVKSLGKRVVLVTNAHGKALAIKFRHTQLGDHLDAVVCSHDLGIAKEHVDFWEKLQSIEPFDKEATLLIDDSLPVLRAASRYGIGQLLSVCQPDSKMPAKDINEFQAIRSFGEIMPS